MSEDDGDKAHEILELFQDLIISIGVTLLKDLTAEQQDYVLVKCHDEFRFWRIEDALKENGK